MGDQLLRSGRSDSAVSTYNKALRKVEHLQKRRDSFVLWRGDLQGYEIQDSIVALMFKLQASLAASYLQSQRYLDVLECTDIAFSCCGTLESPLSPFSEEWWGFSCKYAGDLECWHKYWYYHHKGFWDDQRFDAARAFYCRAIALKHTGDVSKAVKYMERALHFDPGDGHAFMQLEMLRRRSGSEGEAEEVEPSLHAAEEKQEKCE